MSALPPKADIGTQSHDVRFVPKADSCTAARSMSVMRTRTVAARMAATITNLLWNKGCDGSDSRLNKNRLYFGLMSAGFAGPHVSSAMIRTMLRPDHVRESRKELCTALRTLTDQ